MSGIYYPGSCLGILGGGQLGRMLSMVAKQMGYKVAILEPDPNCPAKGFADFHIQAQYHDKVGLKSLAEVADIVTTEFENVPAAALDYLNEIGIPAYPKANAVMIAQNRLSEKSFFKSLGLQTAPYQAILSSIDCEQVNRYLLPGILKTTTQGYDGKGQKRVNTITELLEAYDQLGGECILEGLVDLEKEVSIIVARNQNGVEVYPLIENEHSRGILDLSTIPANVDPKVQVTAKDAAIKMVEALDYIGVLTIEFFVTRDNKLLVNEIAPRPHNSGHITIECCITSQFEQQLRAVCGLPLGSTQIKSSGMMLNLLGDIWTNTDNHLPFAKIINHDPNIKLHWYDKQVAKPGRKMGHLVITGKENNQLRDILNQLKHKLGINSL